MREHARMTLELLCVECGKWHVIANLIKYKGRHLCRECKDKLKEVQSYEKCEDADDVTMRKYIESLEEMAAFIITIAKEKLSLNFYRNLDAETCILQGKLKDYRRLKNE